MASKLQVIVTQSIVSRMALLDFITGLELQKPNSASRIRLVALVLCLVRSIISELNV